jgi:porin
VASLAEAQDPTGSPSLLGRATLTGDCGGLRSALGSRGVEVRLANYGDLLGIVSGGNARRAVYADLLEPAVAVDLDRLARWPGAALLVRGIGTYGTDPIEVTGSIHSPSNVAAAVDTFTLFEAWLEQRFLGDALSIRVGLYALDAEFDVKHTAGGFMNSGFGTGLDLSETGVNGPCIFPVSCLGLRLRVQPTPSFHVQAAVLDGVAGDPAHPHGTQVRLDAREGALVATEVGYDRSPGGGRFLRAALGAWLYTAEFPDVLALDARGNPRQRRGTHGVYGLVEGELFREADQQGQGLGGFLRAGLADQHVNRIGAYVGGGLVYTGLVPGRDADVTGIGVSAGINGERFRTARRRAGSPVDGGEIALEWTYLVPVLPSMRLQLDLQYIVNPGTDPAATTR